MKLFVGLGNPGRKYAMNRHNLGFMVIDRIAADHGFSSWKPSFQGEISEGRLAQDRILLLKPETFMNLSGQSVRAAIDFYKLSAADVTVFHDELDLAPGKLRLKQGGGHAGHNGLRSINAHIGPDYRRVRLGIGHPGQASEVIHYVLQDFSKADRDWMGPLFDAISSGIAALAAGDGQLFMNIISQRVAPARNKKSNSPPGQESMKLRPRETPTKPVDTRPPIERLIDRFR